MLYVPHVGERKHVKIFPTTAEPSSTSQQVGKMREKICSMKRSYKVTTCIGRTHPTSGHSTYKYKQVRGTPTLSTRVPWDNGVRATASSPPSSFLSSNSNSADAQRAGWGFADSRFAQLWSHMIVKMLDNVTTVWGATRTGQA
jgi:hypothetical protein